MEVVGPAGAGGGGAWARKIAAPQRTTDNTLQHAMEMPIFALTGVPREKQIFRQTVLNRCTPLRQKP